MTLAKFIRNQMAQRGMDGKTFAEFIGVAPSTISRMSKDDNEQMPTLDFLSKLADKTDTNINTLVNLVVPPKEDEDQAELDAAAVMFAQIFEKLSDEEKVLIERLIAVMMEENAKKLESS